MKRRNFKKVISVVMSAAMLGVTLFTGNAGSTANAATTESLVSGVYNGNAGYIQTFLKSEYLQNNYNAFELKYEYTELGTLAEDDELGYNNTLQFVVFDNDWHGWEPTMIGPNGCDKTAEVTPTVGEEYTVTIPFGKIEQKLSTGNKVLGTNFQTGGVSDCKIKINSLTYTEAELESEPVELAGAWKKTSGVDDTEEEYGSVALKDGFAEVSNNAWNIGVSRLDVHTFNTPIVAVTVEYVEITNGPIYPQAEVLTAEGQPIVANYPEVSAAGEVTYLTKIPKSTTDLILAYDSCTVKRVEIYDEDENYATTVNDLTNETPDPEETEAPNKNIIHNMGAGWNLGNALDSVAEGGTTAETAWGNPTINKRTFKVLAEAGFKTVRIPVTTVDGVTLNGENKTNAKFDTILDRVKEVVDMARAYDLFVIIDLHHDGSEGVAGQWIDVDAADQTKIRAAFTEVWGKIADKFKDYDQHLIFESMNEVMENGKYEGPVGENTWGNINELNQIFVNTVRATGENNTNRFLLVPGYNTNIDQTVSNQFVMPTDSTPGKIMVSVHFYDPYNFTLNTEEGNQTDIDPTDLDVVTSQFNKLKKKFVNNNIPVVVGEFGAKNKNNLQSISTYITKVVTQAKQKGLGYIYWDNGYTGENGMGLWNRYTYGQSDLGKILIPILTQ